MILQLFIFVAIIYITYKVLTYEEVIYFHSGELIKHLESGEDLESFIRGLEVNYWKIVTRAQKSTVRELKINGDWLEVATAHEGDLIELIDDEFPEFVRVRK